MGGVGFGPGGLAGGSNTHNYSVAGGLTKTFTSTLLADFRFGYFKYNPSTFKPDAGTTPMTSFGIPNANLTGPQAAFTSGLGGFLLNQTVSSSSANTGAFSNPTVSWGDGLGVGRCNCPLLESEQQFQWVTNWTKIKGNHQFKFGADIRYAMNLRVPSDANRAGDYTFDYRTTSNGGGGGLDWATFLLGDVTQMSRYVSPTVTAAERQHRMFYYGQDTWRVTPKLTLNYGLRWEVYFPEYVNGKGNGGFANLVQGLDRVAGYGPYGLNGNIANDWHYFAPRVGIAYQLTEKTVLRMGYGRSYDMGVFGSNFGHTVTQTLPVLAAQLAVGQNQEIPAFHLAQGPPPFNFPTIPSSGVLPVAGPACYQKALTDPVTGNNDQLCVQPHIRPTFQRLPELDAWNLTVQHQINHTTSIEIAYIGNKGTHVFAGDGPTYNINNPAIGPGTTVGLPLSQLRPSCTGGRCITNSPTPGMRTQPIHWRIFPMHRESSPAFYSAARPIKTIILGNDASSNYNAAQVEVTKRFSHGFQFLSHYTFAHAYKYDNNYYADSPGLAYGPDDEVRNHVWVNNLVYELPFGQRETFWRCGQRSRKCVHRRLADFWNHHVGQRLAVDPELWRMRRLRRMWAFAGLTRERGTFQVGAGSFNPVTHQVPFFTPIPNIVTNPGGPFSDPGAGNLGNIGVYSYRGPRAFFSDATILKNFRLTERFRLQFRMDAFNVFNHPVLGWNNNQGGTGTCIDCASNGQITNIEADSSPGSATGMRQLEFALKLIF